MSVPVSDQSRIERFCTDVLGFTEPMDDRLEFGKGPVIATPQVEKHLVRGRFRL
jgi:hypothetical protein